MIISNAGEDADKLDDSYIAGGNEKWYNPSEKWFDISYKIKHAFVIILQQVDSRAFIPGKLKLRFTQKPVHEWS